MRICVGEDVTINSDIRQPAPLQPLEKGGANMPANRFYGWSGNVTACFMVWIDSGDVGATGGETAIRYNVEGSSRCGVGVYQGQNTRCRKRQR